MQNKCTVKDGKGHYVCIYFSKIIVNAYAVFQEQNNDKQRS